jgi:tetratricopeptide (TPR) repeat protein
VQIPRFVSLLITLTIFLGLTGCAHIAAPAPSGELQVLTAGPYLTMMLARYAEVNGDTNKALDLYTKIDDPYAQYAIARISYNNNDFNRALVIVEKLLQANAYVEEALDIRMRIYARTERWDEAMTDAERLLKHYPDNKNLRMHLGRLKLLKSDFKGARKVLEGMSIENDDYDALYLLSKACLGERDLACARKALEDAVDGGADFSPIYMDLGKIYENEGRYEDAEDTYLKLLDLDPESKEAHGALVDLYIAAGRNLDAITQLKDLLDIYPRKEILQKLIILELDNKMFADALGHLKSQKTMSNEDWQYMAIAYAGLRRWDEALQAVEKIPPEGDLGCDAIQLKASILEDMGRTDAALAELKTAWGKYAKEGTCKEVGYRLATALEEKGQRAEGMAVAMYLLEQDPGDAMMLNFVGYVWADEGRNLDKAHKMIQEALKQKPDDGYVLDSMGWILFKSGKYAEAARYMERALLKFGDDPIINIHMGDIQCALGHADRALDYYLKARVNAKKADNELNKKIARMIKNPGQSGCAHDK